MRADYVVRVPGWHPAGINRLLRMHPIKRWRVLRSDAEMVATYARLSRVPKAAGPRRVGLTLVLAGNDRRRDNDNTWKSVLDALVKAGLILDDGPEHLETEPVTYLRADERGTVIRLTELEETSA
jgi:Holliday junction resolvase RusA-like endonuclease